MRVAALDDIHCAYEGPAGVRRLPERADVQMFIDPVGAPSPLRGFNAAVANRERTRSTRAREAMRISLPILVIVASLLATAATAQPSSDPRIADLVQAGKVRFGTFPPQYTKDPTTGELKGPWVEVMRALGAHMDLPVVLTELPNPSDLVKCLDTGACDIGSLGFDPTRADQVGGFSPAFMQVEYTYLVPAVSALRSVVEVDRAGVRIAVVRNHASTLALGRIVKQAEQISAETPDAAFGLLRSGRVDAWASVRPVLLDYSAALPGSRVLEDSYGANSPALVVPKGQALRLAYISEFIEAAKTSGLVQRAIDRAGQPGYRVAAPAR
jgi:polar amino acid transport system substrate-binding protein